MRQAKNQFPVRSVRSHFNHNFPPLSSPPFAFPTLHEYLDFQYSDIFKLLLKIYANKLDNLCFSLPPLPENPGSGFLVYTTLFQSQLEDLLTSINLLVTFCIRVSCKRCQSPNHGRDNTSSKLSWTTDQ